MNYQLKNEVSEDNFNNYKRIYNWQPFMKEVYKFTIVSLHKKKKKCPVMHRKELFYYATLGSKVMRDVH